jgi:hypothetical protein
MSYSTLPVIVSKTGKAYGWGSECFKGVSWLSKEERMHLREGTAHVLVGGCPPDRGGKPPRGITLRLVYFRPRAMLGGHYGHRVVPEELLERVGVSRALRG